MWESANEQCKRPNLGKSNHAQHGDSECRVEIELACSMRDNAGISRVKISDGTNQLGPRVRCSGSAQWIAAIAKLTRTAGQRGSVVSGVSVRANVGFTLHRTKGTRSLNTQDS